MLVYKAAWLKDQGRPFAKQAAIAKLYTGELSNRAANTPPDPRRLRLHGRVPISRLYRDQKILEIGEGTNEVQRMVIARHLAWSGRRRRDPQIPSPIASVPRIRRSKAVAAILALTETTS